MKDTFYSKKQEIIGKGNEVTASGYFILFEVLQAVLHPQF